MQQSKEKPRERGSNQFFNPLTQPISARSKKKLHFASQRVGEQERFSLIWLDTPFSSTKNAAAALNRAAGFGDPITLADSRLAAIFTSVCNTTGTSSMAGRGGDTFGYAGSSVPVRQPRHAPASSVWRRSGGLHAHHTGGLPMSKFRRALRTLFPVSASLVSIVASEPEARALAALLTAKGQRAIYPVSYTHLTLPTN